MSPLSRLLSMNRKALGLTTVIYQAFLRGVLVASTKTKMRQDSGLRGSAKIDIIDRLYSARRFWMDVDDDEKIF